MKPATHSNCAIWDEFNEQHHYQSVNKEPYSMPNIHFLMQIRCRFNAHFSWIIIVLAFYDHALNFIHNLSIDHTSIHINNKIPHKILMYFLQLILSHSLFIVKFYNIFLLDLS